MTDYLAQPERSTTRAFGEWLSGNWPILLLVVYGIWVIAPFFAPAFMQVGWEPAGKAIYFIYSFFCHQLPERSLFLFGGKSMYSLDEIRAAWQDTLDPMVLRQFIGSESMGWKIAWSDRMISFYTSIWILAVLWIPLRRRIRALHWTGFVLLLLPLIMDGASHMISDLSGIGQGFRDANQWLAALTDNSLPASFYAGDALGSFNSIMRWISGILAGLGVAWFVFPNLLQAQALVQEADKLKHGKISG